MIYLTWYNTCFGFYKNDCLAIDTYEKVKQSKNRKHSVLNSIDEILMFNNAMQKQRTS